MAATALTLHEDVLSSLSGFDSWWESQRRAAAAAPRLALDLQPRAAQREAFQFVAGAHLSLSSTAPEVNAQGRRAVVDPFILEGAGAPAPPPRPALEPEPAAPGREAAPLPQADAPAPTARQLHGSLAADAHLGHGAVRAAALERPMVPTMTQRMHPHHPFYTDPSPQPRAAARAADRAASAPATARGRGRRPAWDDGGGGGSGGSGGSGGRGGRRGGRVGGSSGLFDPELRTGALIDEERRQKRRAAAAAVSLSELSVQLQRVRARLEQTTGIAEASVDASSGAAGGSGSGGGGGVSGVISRLQPYQKAQLRRLSRLETEIESLHREPLSGGRDVTARRLLQEELKALSADVMPTGSVWPRLESALQRAAAAAGGAAAAREAAANDAVGEEEAHGHGRDGDSGVSDAASHSAGMSATEAAAGTGAAPGPGGGVGGGSAAVFSQSFPSVLSRVEAGARQAEAAQAAAEAAHEALAASLKQKTREIEARLKQTEEALARAFRTGPGSLSSSAAAQNSSRGGRSGGGGGGRDGFSRGGGLSDGGGGGSGGGGGRGETKEWHRHRTPPDSPLDLESPVPPSSVSDFLRAAGEERADTGGGYSRGRDWEATTARAPSVAPRGANAAGSRGPASLAASRSASLRPSHGPSSEDALGGGPPSRHDAQYEPNTGGGSYRGQGLSGRERGEVLAALSMLDAIGGEHDAMYAKWVAGGGRQDATFSEGRSCVGALTQESRQLAAARIFRTADVLAGPGSTSAGLHGGSLQHPTVYPSQFPSQQPSQYPSKFSSKGTSQRPAQQTFQQTSQRPAQRAAFSPTPRTVRLPAQMEAAIFADRIEFERRLGASGVAEPWRLVESVARDLVEEAVDDTARELVSAADATLDVLCREEFGV